MAVKLSLLNVYEYITRGPVGLTRIATLTLLIPGFLASVVPGAFHLHPVTHLSLTSDDLKFVQNYFGVGLIFCGKKHWDQKYNDVTMTSSLL